MSRPKGPVTAAERNQRRKAASQPRHHRHPRKPPGLPGDGENGPDSTYVDDADYAEARRRRENAAADREAIARERDSIELATMKRALIPADDARDAMEQIHLAWVAELDQLPHAVASALPPEVPASIRELVRGHVEAACIAIRRRIGGAEP